MTPLNSNTLNKKCGGGISSNCVTFDGPALDCIQVCAGTSITEPIVATANLLCTVIDQLDLTGIDLKCLGTGCSACDNPPTLLQVLQVMINKICELEARAPNKTTIVPYWDPETGTVLPPPSYPTTP